MKLFRFKDKNGNNAINYNQLEIQYPVNKVEIFYDDDDHSNWLGFTWELVCIGRTPVGIDVNDIDFDTIGKTGGSKYLQGHYHDGIKWYNTSLSADGGSGSHYMNMSVNNGNSSTVNEFHTGNVNSSTQTGNSGNLQPYEVVAYWRRIA